MKTFRLILCALLLASPAIAQSPGPTQTTQQNFLLNTSTPPVSSAAARIVGNPGPATVYYWIVANYPVGSSSPAGPFAVANVPNTLSGSNYVAVSPSYPLGATSLDLLKTSSPVAPSGACACAVATGVTSGNINDQSNSTSAYTVNPFNASAFTLSLANEVTGAGATHLVLRQGGVFVADLSTSGGFTVGGDLAANSGVSQEVTGILNHALPVLTTGFLNWTGTAWALSAGGGGTPCVTTPGSIQYDNSGAFGCATPFTFSGSTQSVASGGILAFLAGSTLNLSALGSSGSFLVPSGNCSASGTLNLCINSVGQTISIWDPAAGAGAGEFVVVTPNWGTALGFLKNSATIPGLYVPTLLSTADLPALPAGQIWNGVAGLATATSTPTLGGSGALGSITFGNATSGTVTLQTITGALGSVTASLPANTGQIAEINLAQAWSALQTFAGNASIGTTAHGPLVSENTGAAVATAAGAANTIFAGAGGSADPLFKSWADLTFTDYAAATGTAQAQVVTLTNPVTSVVAGLTVRFLPVAANTGAAPTLAVNGLGAKAITKLGTVALVANDLTTTAIATVIYDGTEFQLQNPQNTTGGGGPGTGTLNAVAYWATTTTLGSVASAVTGQVVTFQNGAAPIAASPGLSDSASSPVTTAGYAIQCDSATAILDRGHTIRFQSGASAPTIPLSSGSGCTGLAVGLLDDGAGSITVSRTGADTFTVVDGVTKTDGATSFTMTDGTFATVSQAATNVWEVRLSNGNAGHINGAVVPASATVLGSNSSSQVIAAALSTGQIWNGVANLPSATSTPTLGASGTLGTITFGNATSGLITLAPATGALGSQTATLPINTGTLAELNFAQTWSALQTFGSNASIGANAHGVLVSENTGAVVSTAAGAANALFAGGGASADPLYKSWADLTFTDYAVATGTAQAQVVTLAPAATSLVAGLTVRFLPVAANTGAAPTLAVNGLTATAITKTGTTALVANDLTTTAIATVIYDGTEFQLQNPQTAAAGGATAWSAIGNPTGALSLTMGTNTSTFTYTSGLSNAFLFQNTTAATVTTPQSSPMLSLAGTAWVGAGASGSDGWTIQVVPTAGLNGNSVLTFAHTGTSTGHTQIGFPTGNAITSENGTFALVAVVGTAVQLMSGSDVAISGSNNSNVISDQFGDNSSGTALNMNMVTHTPGQKIAVTTMLKATAALTSGQVVKVDTSNANSVVVATTTDTAAGAVLGFVVGAPGAGASANIAMPGSVLIDPVLGTGTCSIGNFVIVDTTTNGRVKCTGTYTAGTVLGYAITAQATVGSAVSVYVQYK